MLSKDEAKFVFERGCEQLIVARAKWAMCGKAEAYFAKKRCKVLLQPTPETIHVFNKSLCKEDRAFSRDLLKRTGTGRECAMVDIQIISRKAHPPTGLNGWVDSRTRRSAKAPACRTTSASQTCKPCSLSRKIVRSQRGVRSTAEQVLRGPQQQRQNWRRAHDREKLEHNIRALQSTGRGLKQQFSGSLVCPGLFPRLNAGKFQVLPVRVSPAIGVLSICISSA